MVKYSVFPRKVVIYSPKVTEKHSTQIKTKKLQQSDSGITTNDSAQGLGWTCTGWMWQRVWIWRSLCLLCDWWPALCHSLSAAEELLKSYDWLAQPLPLRLINSSMPLNSSISIMIGCNFPSIPTTTTHALTPTLPTLPSTDWSSSACSWLKLWYTDTHSHIYKTSQRIQMSHKIAKFSRNLAQNFRGKMHSHGSSQI